jgi:hypothetical protein
MTGSYGVYDSTPFSGKGAFTPFAHDGSDCGSAPFYGPLQRGIFFRVTLGSDGQTTGVLSSRYDSLPFERPFGEGAFKGQGV